MQCKDGIRRFLIDSTDTCNDSLCLDGTNNDKTSENIISNEEKLSESIRCETEVGQLVTNFDENVPKDSTGENALHFHTGIERFLAAQHSKEETDKMISSNDKTPLKMDKVEKCTSNDAKLAKKTGIQTYFSNTAVQQKSTIANTTKVEQLILPSTSTSKELDSNNQNLAWDGEISNVDLVVCEKCGERISAWVLPEHLDYHFAKELQDQERNEPPKKKLKTAGKIFSFFSSNN